MVGEGYLQGRNKAMLVVWSRFRGALVLLGVVWLLLGSWQELSIPLAVSVGMAANALWILRAVAREAGRQVNIGAHDDESFGSR